MGAGGEAGGREAGLTSALARFLAQSRWEDVPAAIRHEGKRGILNALGCILAGREDPAIAIVRKVFPLEDALIDAAAATEQLVQAGATLIAARSNTLPRRSADSTPMNRPP